MPAESFGKHPWERQDLRPFPAALPMRTHLTYVFRSRPFSISSEISKRCSVICITSLSSYPETSLSSGNTSCLSWQSEHCFTAAACMGSANKVGKELTCLLKQSFHSSALV